MPRLLTAQQIAEEALMEIGAFSPRDEGADPDELDRALSALDLICQEKAGVVRTTWLVGTEFSVPLTAGQGSYNLMTVLGSQYPQDGIQFPLEAWLQHPAPINRQPIDIVRRADYYAHGDLAQPGIPEMAYIDRRNPGTLFIWPVISLPGYSIQLSAQTFTPDFMKKHGEAPHGLPAAWQRWAVLATACDIGGGKVRSLPLAELTDKRRERDRAYAQLEAFNNNERFGRKRFVAYRDF